MSSLRGVMVGAGYFAGFQAEAWQRIVDVEIVAVADPVPGKAEMFAAKWRIPRAYLATAEMIEKEQPDFVDIVARPEAHFEAVKLVSERRLPMICQKPLASTWPECVELVDTCERAGVRLLIHENWRWHPWYREIKRLLTQGFVGRPFQITLRWRTGDGRGPAPYADQPYFREMPRLLAYETLVHLFDTLRFLLGEMRSVFCQMRRVNPAIIGEDQAIIQVEFQNDSLGLIDANRISGPIPPEIAMSTCHIEGDKANIRMTPDGRIWLTEFDKSEMEHPYHIPAIGYRGDSVRATQQHLIGCLTSGDHSETEGREYLKTMRAAFACYDSAQSARTIDLDKSARE